MWQPFVRVVANYAAKRGDSYSAGQQDSRAAHVVVERQIAERPVAILPIGVSRSTLLKAVSRRRVVNVRRSS